MNFDDADSIVGRFPGITVNMDEYLKIGSRAVVRVAVTVKEIRHEQTAGGVRRVHVFTIDSMTLEQAEDQEAICQACEQILPDSNGTWVGDTWVCTACIQAATPWVNSKEGVAVPIPHAEREEDEGKDAL